VLLFVVVAVVVVVVVVVAVEVEEEGLRLLKKAILAFVTMEQVVKMWMRESSPSPQKKHLST
jgi:hypothetical protein